MRFFIVILLLALSSKTTIINAQYSEQFDLHIESSKDVIPYSITEDDFGNFYIVGRYLNEKFNFNNVESFKGFIIKVDKDGNLLKEVYLEDTLTGEFKDILITSDNELIVVGGLTFKSASENRMTLVKFTTELDIVWIKKYANLNTSLSFIEKIDDETLWAGGDMYNVPNYGLLNINTDGDSLNYIEIKSGETLQENPNVIINGLTTSNNKVYSIAREPTNTKHKYRIDESTNELEQSFPLSMWLEDNSEIPATMISGTSMLNEILFTNATYFDPNSYYDSLTGDSNFFASQKMYLSKIYPNTGDGFLLTILEPETMSDTTKIYSGGVSKKDNYMFIGGTYNRVSPKILDLTEFSERQTSFILVKANENGESELELRFPHNDYTVCNTTLATNDGGCVMLGTKYSSDNSDNLRDFYLLKIVPDDLSYNDKKSYPPIKVYPNPSSSVFYFDWNGDKTSFSVFDAKGKRIKTGLTENKNKIDLSKSEAGIYFLKLDYQTIKLVKF